MPRGVRLLILLFCLFPGKAAVAQEALRTLTWLGGQPTGGWFQQSAGIAELLKGAGARIAVKPAAGAAFGNLNKVQDGAAELAWSLPPVIAAAYQGEAPFAKPQSDVRLVMTGLGFVVTQVCVADESPARTVRDLFAGGAPVALGAPRPGGSDDWELRKIFAFYGTSYEDFQRRGGRLVVGSFADMVGQFRERKIDAFMLNNAIPAEDVEQAARGRRTRILPMDDDLLRALAASGIVRGVVPKGSYRDLANGDRDIPTAAMANTIVASVKLPDEVVYEFTRTLLAKLPDLRRVHPGFADFDPRDAVRLANVPLHPGAERAYREVQLLP